MHIDILAPPGLHGATRSRPCAPSPVAVLLGPNGTAALLKLRDETYLNAAGEPQSGSFVRSVADEAALIELLHGKTFGDTDVFCMQLGLTQVFVSAMGLHHATTPVYAAPLCRALKELGEKAISEDVVRRVLQMRTLRANGASLRLLMLLVDDQLEHAVAAGFTPCELKQEFETTAVLRVSPAQSAEDIVRVCDPTTSATLQDACLARFHA